MKNLILVVTFLFISSIARAQSVSICNVNITDLSVNGEVGLTNTGLDTSKMCITLTGTADLCDENGKVIGSGLTLTLESSGCNRENRTGAVGSSPDKLFLPLELLGDAPEFQGKEIPLVFPNPNNGIFTLKTKTPNLSDNISIVSLSNGKKVNANIVSTEKGYNIDLTGHPSGVYVVTYNKNGLTFTQKIIKK